MTITIKEREVTLKRTFRAMIIFESITDGKMFTPKTTTDIITYFYSVVMASDRDSTLTYDEFIDWLDENRAAIIDFTNWIIENDKADASLLKDKKKARVKKESK